MNRSKFLAAACAAAVAAVLSLPAAASAQATRCKDGTTTTASGKGACSQHGGVDRAVVTARARSGGSRETAAPGAVTCADGSTSNPGKGACSRHGGIAPAAGRATPTPTTRGLKPAPAPAAPATPATPATPPAQVTPAGTARPALSAMSGGGDTANADPAGATARCKDGSYSHTANRRGACSRHGGVAQWMGG